MIVIPVTKKQCETFVIKKHYSHRASIFWQGFALVEEGLITGVCVYGQPSPPIQKHSFKDRDFKLYELSRLVVQSKTKNAASFLIGNSLKQLEKPSAVVSYADTEQGHAGIVYQSTNWLYTGATKSHDHLYIIDGKRTHPMTLRDKGITNPKEWAKENNIETVKPLEKHRYFFINGNKRDKKSILKKLKYKVLNQYPKCEKKMYDSGDDIKMTVF